MKKTVYLMALALVVLYGCAKEESNDQIEEQSSDLVWVFNNLDGEFQTWETMLINELPSNSDVTTIRGNNGNSAHTHGDYTFGITSFSWSGTQNNGGTHGSGVSVWILGPPFNTTLYLTLDTECVTVEGNEAVYGGTFTEVLNNPFPPGGPFDVGNAIYFKVIDNGQGNNASPDQHAIGGFIVPAGSSFCGVFPVTDPIWEQNGVLDIAEPGSVKVNN